MAAENVTTSYSSGISRQKDWDAVTPAPGRLCYRTELLLLRSCSDVMLSSSLSRDQSQHHTQTSYNLPSASCVSIINRKLYSSTLAQHPEAQLIVSSCVKHRKTSSLVLIR